MVRAVEGRARLPVVWVNTAVHRAVLTAHCADTDAVAATAAEMDATAQLVFLTQPYRSLKVLCRLPLPALPPRVVPLVPRVYP